MLCGGAMRRHTTNSNTFAIFLKPLILPARSAGKIKGFGKMASMLE